MLPPLRDSCRQATTGGRSANVATEFLWKVKDVCFDRKQNLVLPET